MEDNNLDWLKRQLTISEEERRQLRKENELLRETIVALVTWMTKEGMLNASD